jgi:Tol biopolymer transport system component
MSRKLLPLLLLLLFVSATHAAPGAPPIAPLIGPLVAADTAAQDRILIYDLGSGERRELTFGTGWQRVWDFSPDGCSIALTMSDGSVPASLYTARIDGSDVQQLVRADGTSGAWEPQWGSSDRIAYTRIDADGKHYIAWINPTTRETGTYSITGDEHTARWSPDRQWLVYASYETRIAGADIFSTAEPTRAGEVTTTLREADLWIVSAGASSDKYRLTNFPVGSVSMPRWSPDGDLIGFVYSPAGNNDQFWMIGVSPDAVPTQLSFQWALALDLTWLPDSTAMIASAQDIQGVRENRLWRIPLTGNADANANQYILDPALSYDDYPRFSPDGRWLALRSEYALALVNTADASWTWLDETTLGNTPPVWTPTAFAGESACA